MFDDVKEPTADQCSAGSAVWAGRGRLGFAAWYPQMGGYVGKAVVIVPVEAGPNECFDVLVWHDGEFPFRGESDGTPVRLHHCMAEQFVRFGETVKRLMPKTEGDE